MTFAPRPFDYIAELKYRDETISRQAERIQQLEAKIEELTQLLEGKAQSKAAKKPKFTENYSLNKNSRKKKDARNQQAVAPRMSSET